MIEIIIGVGLGLAFIVVAALWIVAVWVVVDTFRRAAKH